MKPTADGLFPSGGSDNIIKQQRKDVFLSEENNGVL